MRIWYLSKVVVIISKIICVCPNYEKSPGGSKKKKEQISIDLKKGLYTP